MKKTIHVLLLCLFVCIACSKDEQIQQEQTVEANSSAARVSSPKIQVCHFAKSDNIWELIEVNEKSLEKHLEHGDVILDADGDGYAAFNDCGYLNENGIDCDDTNAAINPGASEICDGIDNNCDGNIDEGVKTTFYADADSDGFGDISVTMDACSTPLGYVSDNTDCDDTNTAINPGATEVCDGVDNNCDGTVDEGCSTSLSIGDDYQGGKIAYILQSGDPGYDANVQHGLIAAPSDQGTGAWGCGGTPIGASGWTIGTGNLNTIDIMAGCSTTGIAARICGDLVLNGYSDWYLPSRDELLELARNQSTIGGTWGSNYWSSSEFDSDNALAVRFDYIPVFAYAQLKSATTWNVRAVRSF